MAYIVDRVVICDAFREPDKHYQLLPGGRSRLAQGRRPSVQFLASARDVKGGLAGIVGKEAGLFEDMLASDEQKNDFVNHLRDEVRAWREDGYPGTALVTRRQLEWWFERDEERRATGRRFFFCQQEAIETVIYLYEVQKRRRMPETGDLVRYALKLATGTGKTVVMALLVTWSTLHKRKVSGSSLSSNFLVLVPNLTVRQRVSGVPRGDGLLRSGEHNLYDAFDTVPPEYRDEFHPNVEVRNWQGIPLEAKRDDWISDEIVEAGRFIPAAVLRAMRRRAQQDPNAVIRRMLGGWRDVVIINDEAHHVYGEKRKLIREASENGINGGFAWLKATGYSSMRITSSKDYPELVGKYLSELARERKLAGFDLVSELVLGAANTVGITLGAIKEEDVRALMVQPWNMIASDGAYSDSRSTGSGHPRSTGTFARVLGHYVREVKLLKLEEAIRKMTSLPADHLGLRDRGRISQGMAADVCIFDPKTVRDRSTWDQPHLMAEGVHYVVVNGVSVLTRGQLTDQAPGRFVPRQR
jgi:amidohydrolase family protein/type III restriction/modification enzyme restriction subunit